MYHFLCEVVFVWLLLCVNGLLVLIVLWFGSRLCFLSSLLLLGFLIRRPFQILCWIVFVSLLLRFDESLVLAALWFCSKLFFWVVCFGGLLDKTTFQNLVLDRVCLAVAMFFSGFVVLVVLSLCYRLLFASSGFAGCLIRRRFRFLCWIVFVCLLLCVDGFLVLAVLWF